MSYTSDSDAVSGICGLSEGGRKRNWPTFLGCIGTMSAQPREENGT